MTTQVRVNFSRRFVSGILAGITLEDSLSFPARGPALAWVRSVVGRDCKSAGGTSAFRIDRATIVEEVR